MISFIMSVYNTRPEWIDRAVASILRQTVRSWELIIVDDGSKKVIADHCDALMKKDSRIIVHHQKNQGQSVARNYGRDHAKGEWVGFIDADDWIEESYVEQLTHVINEHNDIEALAIGHDDIWGDKSIDRLWGTEEYHEFDVSDREGMQMALLQLPKGLDMYPIFFGAQWKFIYSLAFLNKYNIHNTPGLYKSEDSIFNLYVTEYAVRIGYYNRVLYHYFHNDESITGTGFNRNLEQFQRLILEYEKFINNTGKTGNPIYQMAYTKVGLLQFESMLDKYFINYENSDSQIVRRKLMKEVLNTKPYVELIKNVSTDYLSIYRRMLVKLMQNQNYIGICVLYKFKRKVKRIIR